MANQQVALEIVAKDLATATVNRVNASVRSITGPMSEAVSGAAKWEEGLRRLALQQSAVAGKALEVGEKSHEGLGKASRAVEHLAAEFLGINPKIASLAEGLLAFAGGSALVTGVAAGLAVIGGALFYFEKQAREATAAWKAYIDGLSKPGPFAMLGAALDVEREKLSKMEKQFVSGGGDPRKGYAGPSEAQLEKQRALVKSLEDQYTHFFQESEKNASRLRDAMLFAQGASNRPATRGNGGFGVDTMWGALGLVLDDVKTKIQWFLQPAVRNVLFMDKTRQGLSVEEANSLVGAANLTKEQGGGGFISGIGGEATGHVRTLAEAFQQVTEQTTAAAEAFDGLNASYLAGIPGFGAVAKAARQAIGIIAKVEGTVAIAQGFVKVAKSLFPFNPAELASGLGMIKHGTTLAALGGGGGGGGGAGGGAGSGASAMSQQQAAANARDKITLRVPPIQNNTDPKVQDWFINTLNEAIARGSIIDVQVTG